jgi:glycosyltransferase involved in cell wall biosynthesis
LALGADGVTVDVFCDRTAPAAPAVLGAGVRRFAPSSLRWRLAAAEAPYDVVHVFGLRSLRSVAPLATAAHRVYSPHLDRWSQPPPADVLYRTWPRPGAVLNDGVDTLVCASELEATRVRREAPELALRLHVVRPGIEVEALQSAEPMKVPRAVVLAIGQLRRRVCLVRVIGALASLDDRFTLVVIGEGPARRWLHGFASDLGVARRVRFLGSVTSEDRRRWMKTASVLIPLSQYEDTETMALEAAALGKPMVVPDSPEDPWVVVGPTGGAVRVLAGRSSPLAIADAVRESATVHGVSDSTHELRSWIDHGRELRRVYEGLDRGTVRPGPFQFTRRRSAW